ncbi:DUF2182 domain-containing protein [Parasedimentitalea maritima]|uniref:DUF2182 domain-containing protein n=1 Tax=Parasedimentitalea maritima TaxID=2578117 RepID=A0A6A4RB48_9RHOB|nr:DUF2182 domain-containing protein [Zongyanglinia marina]KAE9629597.1 DUF2182 domain-containing protein [Zongyanglinia marina]
MAHLKQTPALGPVEKLVRRDKVIVLFSALLIAGLAAWYTLAGAGVSMSMNPVWTPDYALLNFAMWWVMMIAMMTPSAAPMLLLYVAVKRVGSEADQTVGLSLLFLAGYLLAWGGFSLLATAAQWQIEILDLSMGAMMPLTSRSVAGAVLLLAGCYQFSGIKDACLRHCRSPSAFLADHNQPGAKGALRLGILHGGYCLGCCWAMMALLFVGGLMNLYWIAGLALYVLAEKTLPKMHRFSGATGAVLITCGAYFLISSLIN